MAEWYRVVGFGISGRPARTPEAARVSYEAAARRTYGYAEHDATTSYAAHAARLVCATTRRAADAADVSGVRGRAGRGEWWVVFDHRHHWW